MRKQWLELLEKVDLEDFKAKSTSQTMHSFCLTDILDDRPPDAFLIALAQQWNDEEKHFFKNFKPHDLNHLEEISTIWGRKIAQTHILIKEFKTIPHQKSLKGLLEILSVIMFGGSFLPSSFLLRRYTNKNLAYELPLHYHPLTCHLESFIFKGFVDAFALNIQYKRQCFPSYCMDSYLIYDATN